MKTRLAIALSLCLGAIIYAQSAQTRRQFYGTEAGGAKPKVNPLLVKPQIPAVQTNDKATKQKVIHLSKEHPTRDFDWNEKFQPNFALAADWRSTYLRDGWVVNDRPVGTLQLEMTESGGYIGAFSVYDFNDRADDHWNFSEHRLYLGYAARCLNTGYLGDVTVDAGWCYRCHPINSSDSSGEIHFAVRWDELVVRDSWRIIAALTYIRDYDKHRDIVRMDAIHAWLLQNDGGLSWNNTLSLHWGDGGLARMLRGTSRGGNMFYSLGWRSQLRWRFAEGWSLVPYVGVTIFPDGRAERTARRSLLNRSAAFHCGMALEWHI